MSTPQKIVYNFLNLLFSTTAQSEEYWTFELLPMLETKYSGVFENGVIENKNFFFLTFLFESWLIWLQSKLSLKSMVDSIMLCKRIHQVCGISFENPNKVFTTGKQVKTVKMSFDPSYSAFFSGPRDDRPSNLWSEGAIWIESEVNDSSSAPIFGGFGRIYTIFKSW